VVGRRFVCGTRTMRGRRDAMSVHVAAKEQDLEEHHARRPNGRRSAEPRQNRLRDDGLHLKEQERGEEYWKREERHPARSASFDREPIADLGLRSLDYPDRQLEGPSRRDPTRGDPPRPDLDASLDHGAAGIDEEDVDRKPHEKHVDARARLEPQPLPRRQASSAEQASQPRAHADGEGDSVTEDRAGTAIDHAYQGSVLGMLWIHVCGIGYARARDLTSLMG